MNFLCEVNGYPEPSVSWYKDGKLISETPNLLLFDDPPQLKIKSMQISDGGNYSCVATNKRGKIRFVYMLKVTGKLEELRWGLGWGQGEPLWPGKGVKVTQIDSTIRKQ